MVRRLSLLMTLSLTWTPVCCVNFARSCLVSTRSCGFSGCPISKVIVPPGFPPAPPPGAPALVDWLETDPPVHAARARAADATTALTRAVPDFIDDLQKDCGWERRCGP